MGLVVARLLVLVCLGSLFASAAPRTESGRWLAVAVAAFSLVVVLLAAA